MKRLGLLAGCLTIYGAPLVAQAPAASADSAPNACPVLNGIRIGADWGDSSTTSRADSNRRGSFRLGGGTTIDTTLTFDVTNQTWSRSSLTAYVAGGVSGRTRSATTATDPRSSWHACVGITLGMQQPTIVMHGVHGQLHLKIDLTPLTRIPGATLDSSRQNQTRR
jgi:hypothetical protein